MTHDSFAASEAVITEFETANNVKLNFLKSGDAGAAVNKAILSKGNPLADVFFGVDNTFMGRALAADVFAAYTSPALKDVPDSFKAYTQGKLTPIDYGDVCLNYDKAYFQAKNLAVLQTLDNLVKPEYKGLLVVENPATSSPGLAFLFATIARFGESGFLDFWKSLRANDVKVVDGWETAYNTEFSGSAGKGPRPIVVSYASSPPFEVYFSEGKLTEPPTGVVVGAGACYRQIEYAGILRGSKHRALAEKFIDYMLGVRFQEDIPLQMYMYPVNPAARLPEVFVKFAQTPQDPAMLDPALIQKSRETWIEQWTETVLR
jgi:thiamine transport system substrate-binding protein